MGQKVTRTTIPMGRVAEVMKSYSAVIDREYSSDQAHVWFSRPMQKWITVVRKGQNAILTFSDDCPCARVLNGKTPW